MEKIFLNDILSINSLNYGKWTICLNNANEEGIYSFDENPERLLEHISWKKHAGSNISFRNINTNFCLQFIRLDKDNKFNHWLFLGAYAVNGYKTFKDGHETYNLTPIKKYQMYSERLIVEFSKKQGPKQAKINISNIETIKVVKILEKKYNQVNLSFDGFDKVSLEFLELKKIINSNVDNWRELLSNVNAIYCITDMSNGKLYIGSTYGFNGVWQRWSCYVNTNGHGGNVEFKKLLFDDNIYRKINSDRNYAKNFKFSLIEVFYNRNGNVNYILERENYWKGVFESKQFGYNLN